MTLLLAAAAAVLTTAEPLVFRSEATVTDPIVRLADVADLSPLPALLRDRAAGLPVGRADAPETVLTPREASARARAALPGLSRWLPDVAGAAITVRRLQAGVSPAALQVAGDEIAAGETLTLRVEVGPVVVERDVQALQDGQAGQALFVRTAEGTVLTARVTARP